MAKPRVKSSRSAMTPSVSLLTEIGLCVRGWRSAMDSQLRPLGVTQSLWVTLWWIAESDVELNQANLARLVGIESSTLARQLNALVAARLIERIVGADRRARMIRITPKGVETVEKFKRIAEELATTVLSDFSTNEIREHTKMLREMRGKLRGLTSGDGLDQAVMVTGGR
jgi:MarR family transcriptional regulator for hemolysin